MKLPSSFLFDLVHSLSKTEKRYVKLNAKSKDKNYMQLMDAILAQETFDEKVLIEQNTNASFVKHYAVSKRYLYDFILSCLERYKSESVKSRIKRKIADAEVLIEKEMYKAASIELQKGKRLSEDYEMFESQLELFNLEKNLINAQSFKAYDDEFVKDLYKKELTCLEQLKNTSEYWFIAYQIGSFQKRFQRINKDEQRNFIQSIVSSPKFKDINLATNFRSKMFYYLSNSTYQFTKGDVESAFQFNSAFLNMLESNPRLLNLYTDRYLSTLNNMLIDSLGMGKFEELKEGIERLKKIPKRPQFRSVKNINAIVFRQRFLLMLNWSLRQKEFENAMNWIPEIEEGLNRYGNKIEKHHRVTFYYLVAYVCFQNKLYDKALNWLNYILMDSKEDVVKEIYYVSRTFYLIIQYELKNAEYLQSLLISTPKYIRSRRPMYKTEQSLFRFIGKLLKTIEKKDRAELVVNFKKELSELSKIPEEQRFFNYLDLRLWNPLHL